MGARTGEKRSDPYHAIQCGCVTGTTRCRENTRSTLSRLLLTPLSFKIFPLGFFHLRGLLVARRSGGGGGGCVVLVVGVDAVPHDGLLLRGRAVKLVQQDGEHVVDRRHDDGDEREPERGGQRLGAHRGGQKVKGLLLEHVLQAVLGKVDHHRRERNSRTCRGGGVDSCKERMFLSVEHAQKTCNTQGGVRRSSTREGQKKTVISILYRTCVPHGGVNGRTLDALVVGARLEPRALTGVPHRAWKGKLEEKRMQTCKINIRTRRRHPQRERTHMHFANTRGLYR